SCRCGTCSTNGASLPNRCWWPVIPVMTKECSRAARWVWLWGITAPNWRSFATHRGSILPKPHMPVASLRASTTTSSSTTSRFPMTGSTDKGQPLDLAHEADLTLKRLAPRLDAVWEHEQADEEIVRAFDVRLKEHWPRLFRLLYRLYGTRYDFFYHVEQILSTAARALA